MKSLAFVSTLLMFTSVCGAADLTGAGSTFVYPILAKWASEYKKSAGISINYQSIGSGGGIKQIKSKTVEFGATDMPLTSEELSKDGLIQFPLISGAIVPVVNVKGIANNQLKLDGDVLARIFLGQIKKWNDPAITGLNPGLNLPDQAITVVHRSDGSGSTFIWSNYLSKVSSLWKEKAGEGTSINWPAGVGGKGNEGVASYVHQIPGAIGYVEYAYALQSKLVTTLVKNQTGAFVEPKAETFSAAAASANWGKAKDFYLVLTDAPGKTAWPIAGTVFVLMHKQQENAAQAKEVLKFFRWAYNNGGPTAADLHYVPLPKSLTDIVGKTWVKEIKSKDGAAIAVGL